MGHIVYEHTDLRYGFRLENGALVVEAPSEEQITAWRNVAPSLAPLPLTASDRVLVRRIVLDVMDAAVEMHMDERLPELERLALETGAAIVRHSPVPPHVRALPLTLPIRILQVEAPPSAAIRNMLRWLPFAIPETVIETRTCSASELWSGTIARQGPTFDVIHHRAFAVPEGADLHLRIRDLGRLMDEGQTRLLVLEAASSALGAARAFAQRLVARGGPAVVVMSHDAPGAQGFVVHLYGHLIHDRPIDWILSRMAPWVFSKPPLAVFVGAGREELLRVSPIGLGLIDLVKIDPRLASTRKPRATGKRAAMRLPSSSRRRPGARRTPTRAAPRRPLLLSRLQRGPGTGRRPQTAVDRRKNAFANIHREIDRLTARWEDLRFEDSERAGAIPLAESLGRIRSTWPRAVVVSVPEPPRPPEPRRLLADFHGLDGRSRPENALLHADQRVLLGLQIAPGPAGERHLQVPPIVEEQLKWSAEGAWMQIGVTVIDFDVLGDPVQDLLLPRTGSSDWIHFAVVPRRTRHAVPGFARLRYTLYHENRVLQSFLLAARLADGEPDATRVSPLQGYARALSVDPEALASRRLDDISFLSRLEYAEATLADDVTKQPRPVSIIANHSDGTPVITVKTDRAFEVQLPGALHTEVEEVRNALCRFSSQEADEVPDHPHLWSYRFEHTANKVTDEQLIELLPDLAEAGWNLYFAVLSQASRDELEQLLAGEPETIQVAHVLLDKVIPWAAVYSQLYDSQRREDENGELVEHATCLAALRDDEGQIREAACGQAPGCLLSHEMQARRKAEGLPRLLPETVVCPRHFWGFRHIIEIPPQQVTSPAGEGTKLVSTIECERPARLVAGMHPGLQLTKTHEKELLDLIAKGTSQCRLATESVAHQRDEVVDALKTADVHIAYLYCHAHGKLGGKNQPHLAFGGGIIRPSHLVAAPWRHGPLVFLNGCATVGFRPDALSPFISHFVKNRQASGLIGTEIVVFETFASKFALLFLERFLQGDSAGDALLDVRRHILLSCRNPLGLVYTLYAAAGLQLEQPPMPPPAPTPPLARTSD